MSGDVNAVLEATSQSRERAPSGLVAWIAVHRHVLVVWAAMTGWSAVMFALVRADYLGYRLGRFDLGNMVQAVWSTAHGRPLEYTEGLGEQMTRLGAHVDPILVLLTPLWVVVPSPLTLAAAQIVAVSLGALPVLWLGRRHLGSDNAAMLMAVAYLAYPWLSWSALDAIHPVTFAIPLLLYAIWALDADRLAVFAVFAVLVAATGELMGLTIAALGVWYALARGRRREGSVIAALGAAWTFVALLVVVPAFADGASRFYGFYERVGGSPRGLLETAVTDPTAILAEVFAGNVIVFCVALAAPLAGLFLLAPGLAAAALPQLLLNALADPDGPIDPRQHYLAAILPCLFAATVLGLARLRAKDRAPVAAMIVVVSVGLSVLFGPWGPGAEPLWHQSRSLRSTRRRARSCRRARPGGTRPSARPTGSGRTSPLGGTCTCCPRSSAPSGSSSTRPISGFPTSACRRFASVRRRSSRRFGRGSSATRRGRASTPRTASTSSAGRQPDASPGRTTIVISSSR